MKCPTRASRSSPDVAEGPGSSPGADPRGAAFRSLPPHDGSNVEALFIAPRIVVMAQFMDMIRDGDLPAIKSTVHGDTELLTITASNGTWVYVVGQLDSGRDVYQCHWPD